jgi:proline iminopeptidase
MVCPMRSAFDLAKVWPEAKLVVVPDAGHASSEPGIVDALVRATDEYAAL